MAVRSTPGVSDSASISASAACTGANKALRVNEGCCATKMTQIEMLQSPADKDSQHLAIQFNRAATNHRLSRILQVAGHAPDPQHSQAMIIVINRSRCAINVRICPPLPGKCDKLLLDRGIFCRQFPYL